MTIYCRRPMCVIATALALVALCVRASRVVVAQDRMILRTPNASLPQLFSQIRGVRELRDGRVLITDRLEEHLSVANFIDGSLRVISRPGRGPQEYHLPTALVPMPGDSTLMVDEGNSRLAVIGPELRVVRSFALRVPGIPVPLGVRAVDRNGRYYLQIPGWISDARAHGDSVWLIRFTPRGERVDTLARIKGSTSPPSRDGRQMGIPFVPFAPEDRWGITGDGRLAILRSGDNHVEWRGNTGTIQRGPAMQGARLAVTTADRIAFTRSFIANSPIGGRDLNGGMSAAPAELLEEKTIRGIAERNTFAPTMALYADTPSIVASDGSFWLERSTRLGSPSTWDVFDGAGRNVRRVTLPAGRRLVALGAASAYLVSTDDDGLEHLERYAIR